MQGKEKTSVRKSHFTKLTKWALRQRPGSKERLILHHVRHGCQQRLDNSWRDLRMLQSEDYPLQKSMREGNSLGGRKSDVVRRQQGSEIWENKRQGKKKMIGKIVLKLMNVLGGNQRRSEGNEKIQQLRLTPSMGPLRGECRRKKKKGVQTDNGRIFASMASC